jgi:hypothetical protein
MKGGRWLERVPGDQSEWAKALWEVLTVPGVNGKALTVEGLNC